MPIKIDLHDNTSHVRLKPKSNEPVEIGTGSAIDISILEALIRNEISDRIAADQNLQDQINSLALEAARYLILDEKENGSIEISILNAKEEVLDTKVITVTEKIIKSAHLDEEHGKIIYTCNDDSTIELDISNIVDNIEDLLSRVSDIENEITNINQSLSIIEPKVEQINLTLSNLLNETIPTIQNNILDITNDIGDIDLRVSENSADISILNNDVELLKQVDLSIIQSLETKVEQDLSGYDQINPRNDTIEDIQDLLIYISKNGVPKYAKLSDLGYSRVRDDNEFNKADSGDLLIQIDN